MKRILIGLILVLMLATPVFADVPAVDVTAEIIKADLDANGALRVYTQYKIDGVEVESRYPKYDGKYYWITRYDVTNFGDMTNLEILQRIAEPVRQHAKSIIGRKFITLQNQDIYQNKLDGLIGKSLTVQTTTIQVDNDGDGTKDEIWTVKTDGTYTTSPIQ